MSERNSNKKVANGLVAMSSAAVLAVYAAGYTRTEAAARKLDTQSEERRPGQGRGRGSAPAVDAPHDETRVPATPVATQSPDPTPTAPLTAAANPTLLPSAKAVAPAPFEPAPAAALAPANTPAVPEPTPAPVTVVEHKAEPVAAPAAPPPPPPPPAAPKWKDGTYTGWGTSRHGDIQAQVIVEEGRIKSATIAQCYTRYSCDVIDKIIPQVAQRQSPETDFVSGATQSTNAFYYGVVDALSKAK